MISLVWKPSYCVTTIETIISTALDHHFRNEKPNRFDINEFCEVLFFSYRFRVETRLTYLHADWGIKSKNL